MLRLPLAFAAVLVLAACAGGTPKYAEVAASLPTVPADKSRLVCM